MATAERTLRRATSRRSQIIKRVLDAGFPLVALLQLVRVYAQSMRRIAEAEVRLFHLFVHEPLIDDGVPALEMAEEMERAGERLLPGDGADHRATSTTATCAHYIEQDVVGHMEADMAIDRKIGGHVSMAFCFVDLTGFTRYTAEEGDEEALDLVERFVETVEATLPAEATIVKTIGDEVMIVSPDPVTLTEWAVGFLTLFRERTAAADRAPLRQRRLPRRRLLRRATSTSPTGSSPARSPARCWSPPSSPTRSAAPSTSTSSRSARSISRASPSRSSCSSRRAATAAERARPVLRRRQASAPSVAPSRRAAGL